MVPRPNPIKKETISWTKLHRKLHLDNGLINLQLVEENVKTLKLLLFAQLHETESLHALSDCLFDEQLQKGTDLDSILEC